jgi:nitroreductase
MSCIPNWQPAGAHGPSVPGRWAPSCFNEQPWRFVIGVKEQDPVAFEQLASLLVSGNDWAKEAPVLMLSVAKRAFTYNGSPNRHASHDVGLATAMMVIQAESMGLVSHQMGGFVEEKAYEVLSIPRDAYEALTMIALGYPGNPEGLPEGLRERELAPRERQPLQSMVFSRVWEAAYSACFT